MTSLECSFACSIDPVSPFRSEGLIIFKCIFFSGKIFQMVACASIKRDTVFSFCSLGFITVIALPRVSQQQPMSIDI